MGWSQRDVYILEDGSPLDFDQDESGEPRASISSPEQSGLICIDGAGIGDIDESVLKDRKLLSTHGVAICIVGVDSNGDVVEQPILTTRGVINEDTHEEVIDGCVRSVTEAVQRLPPKRRNPHMQTVEVRSAVQRYFKGRLGRRPLVLAVITRADGEPSLG